MNGYTYTKPNGKTYVYYKCRNKSALPAKCEGLTIPAKPLEEFVVKTLTDLSEDEPFLKDKEKMMRILEEESNPDKSKSKKEIAQLKKAENDLMDRRDALLDALEKQVIDSTVFQERFQKLEDLLQKNKLMQSEFQHFSDSAYLRKGTLQASFEEIGSFGHNWEYLDIEGQMSKIRAIVKEISVTKEDIHISLYLDSNGGDPGSEDSGDKGPNNSGSGVRKSRKGKKRGHKLINGKELCGNSQLWFVGVPARKGAPAAISPIPNENASAVPTRSNATSAKSPDRWSIGLISTSTFPRCPTKNSPATAKAAIPPKCMSRS